MWSMTKQFSSNLNEFVCSPKDTFKNVYWTFTHNSAKHVSINYIMDKLWNFLNNVIDIIYIPNIRPTLNLQFNDY